MSERRSALATLIATPGVRQSTLYLLATLVTRLIGLVRMVALAWLLTRAQYGLLQIALLAVNVLLPVMSLGLPDALARFTPHFEVHGGLRRFIGRAALLLGAATTLTFALCVLASPWASGWLFHSRGAPPAAAAYPLALTLLAALTTATLVAYHAGLSIAKGLRRIELVCVLELMNGVVLTVLALVAAGPLGYSTAAAVLVAYALANLLIAAVTGTALARTLPHCSATGPRPDSAPVSVESLPVKTLLVFGAGTGTAALAMQAFHFVPVWLLGRTAGHDEAGLLAAARQFAQIVLIAGATLAAVISAWVTHTWERSAPRDAARTWRRAAHAALAVLFAGALAALLLRGLLRALLPETYHPAIHALGPLLGAFLAGAGAIIAAIPCALARRTYLLPVPWLVGIAATTAAYYAAHLLPGTVVAAPPEHAPLLRMALATLAGAWAALVTALALTGLTPVRASTLLLIHWCLLPPVLGLPAPLAAILAAAWLGALAIAWLYAGRHARTDAP